VSRPEISAVSVIAPYWEPATELMDILFWRKNLDDGNCPSPGLFVASYLQFLELSYVKPIEKYFAIEPWTGTKSQIYSQGELTTLRCKNKKI
jgi:hypothetical protein